MSGSLIFLWRWSTQGDLTQNSDLRRKIKFADTVDIDCVEIHQMFNKECGCPSILIVDDQYINRFIILKYAEKYGIICDEAEDGAEALKKWIKAGEK